MSDHSDVPVPLDPPVPTDSADPPAPSDGAIGAVHAVIHLADRRWNFTTGRFDASGTAEAITGSGGGTVPEMIATVAGAPFPAPAKLALLAELKSRQYPSDQLLPLADALIRTDLTAQDRAVAARLLIDAVDQSKDEPLGRNPQTHFMGAQQPGQPADPSTSGLFGTLVDGIQSQILTLQPACTAVRMQDSQSGQPYLSIRNVMRTTKPLSHFVDLIDPLSWTKCDLQHTFFRRMTPIGVTPNQKLVPPNRGWSGVVEEVVDFGPRLGQMKTRLDMMFFVKPTRIGSTYSLNQSMDKKIQYDEGFLLAEDNGQFRTITTHKSVWFSDEATNLKPGQVCTVWSLASAMLMHACAHD